MTAPPNPSFKIQAIAAGLANACGPPHAYMVEASLPTCDHRSRWRQMLPLIGVSLLAHGIAIGVLPAPTASALTSPAPSAPLVVSLVALPAPSLIARATAQFSPFPAERVKSRPARPTTPAETETTVAFAPIRISPPPKPELQPLSASTPPPIAASPADVAPVAQIDPPIVRPADAPLLAAPESEPSPLAQEAAIEPVAIAQPAAATPARMPSASLPPSGMLNYTVVGTDPRTSPPSRTFGNGTVTWQHEAGTYSIELQAAIDMLIVSINVLASKSTGIVEEYGLAPARYTESPRRRPTVATNFNRDPASPLANTITFSASAGSHPLVPAAQDRLSVIFQLAALLRANPALTTAGQTVSVFVAGVRGDAETWRFTVKGREAIEAGGTLTQALHVQRLPRADSNDRAIDIWYALEQGGYPVQIRYSEANGSRIDLVLKGPN